MSKKIKKTTHKKKGKGDYLLCNKSRKPKKCKVCKKAIRSEQNKSGLCSNCGDKSRKSRKRIRGYTKKDVINQFTTLKNLFNRNNYRNSHYNKENKESLGEIDRKLTEYLT